MSFSKSSPLTRLLLLTCMASVLGTGPVSVARAQDKAAPKSAAANAHYVTVENAWVRPMVKGQSATGGFMVLTASQDLTLVGFATAVARTSELHEMAMDGQVMRMRAIDSLKLPAGQAVTLRPGAHHLMLMDVKQPLKVGDELTLTLKLKAADGKALTQDIKVPVKAAQMQQPMNQEMHQHMHHGKAPAQASSTSK
jgi:periplasmic copper chaperone A